jgi:hypothetical protein
MAETAHVPRNGIADLAAAEDFVRFFAQGWEKPKPEAFLTHFLARVHPEARFEQPTMPVGHGTAGFERGFRELFELFPDYLVTVEGWAARGEVVVIRITHWPTGAGGPSWQGVDWITLEDGLIRERIAYFDSAATLPAALRAPRTWPQLLRWTLSRR